MVLVAVGGLGVAAGCVAGSGAGAEEISELAAGGVAVLGVAVVAVAVGNGLAGGVEGAYEVAETG
jgi:hypothetical protein